MTKQEQEGSSSAPTPGRPAGETAPAAAAGWPRASGGAAETGCQPPPFSGWVDRAARAADVLRQLGERPLFALTEWPPWAWAMLYLGKDIENRGDSLPMSVRGYWVAIHHGLGGRSRFAQDSSAMAGISTCKQIADARLYDRACARVPASRARVGLGGGLVPVGPLSKELRKPSAFFLYESNGPGYRALLRQHVLGLVRFGGCYPRTPGLSGSRWEGGGEWCWRIDGALALPLALPMPGAQGFWRVPDELVEMVRAQLVDLAEDRT